MATHSEYWRRREEAALKNYVKDEREYDKRLAQIYQNMLDSCQKEIDSFYGRYAAAEGITIAEAKKRISKADIAAYERKAARYVKEKNFSKKANEELRLYNATMRINRLEMLKANIGLELIAGHEEIDKFMAGILKGRTEDELKRHAGILGKTIRGNAAKANAIVNASFHNATFSDRVWQYQDLLRAEIGKLLQSGLIQGKNPRVLARELRKTFETSTYNSERLMRTELARVQTEAQKQSYIANGFDEYKFMVNTKCCDVCAALNGKRFKVEKMMPGENAPPIHPNCRCTTVEYFDHEEFDRLLDFIDAGGTEAEWNARKNSGKALENSKNGIYNTSGDVESLSLRFMSNRDMTYKNLHAVPPLDGYEDIACHADPMKFGFVDPTSGKTVQEVGASFFARRVRESGKYNGGPIRLIACEAGRRDDGLAQEFANIMGVKVLAPTKIVFTNSQGYMVLADDEIEALELLRNATEKWNPDGWRIFEPRER